MCGWALLAFATGCAPDSDYALTIDPIAPLNLSMGIGDPDLTLVHRAGATATDPATSTQLYPLGPLSEGDFSELPPLEDGRLGLLLTQPGTASDSYDPAVLRGYGEADLGGGLARGREERTLQMLVTEFGGIGDLGAIARRRAPLLGGAALLANGEAWFIGGMRPTLEAHDAMVRVADLRSGDWEAEEVRAMPTVNGNSGAVVLNTVTALDDGRILVTGGRPNYLSISNNSTNAFVYDPVDDEIDWQVANGMAPGRSRHQAVKMLNGNVVLFGGWQGGGADGSDGTFEIYDAEDERLRDAGTTEVGPLGTNVTAVGGEGMLACGGLSFDSIADILVGRTACVRISLTGDVLPFPADLPEPVSMGAMAALPDGRVLLAGGTTDDIPTPVDPESGFLADDPRVGSASDSVWLYEPDDQAWRALEPLATPRAGARAIPTGDGRFLVFGGASEAGVMISENGEPVFCATLIDPDTGTNRVVGSCSTPGSGAFPLVSTQPGIGALVVQGHRYDVTGNTEQDAGGEAFGILGLAPPL
jgi:hypothetical protein